MMNESKRSMWLGAIFLMATSGIGPGFLTQTSVFTEQIRADFGFVILASVLLAIVTQLNIWRVIGVAAQPSQSVANQVLPGLGYLLSFLMVLGGLAFNIGNIGGAGLGMEAIFGLDPRIGALITATIAVALFIFRDFSLFLDRAVQVAGIVMVILTGYVMFASSPPVGEAALRTVWPEKMHVGTILTLLGGTVGGYITYAGCHRLVDAGISGKENLRQIDRGAILGVGVSALMRVLLFLAVLGVVQLTALDQENPPASVFRHILGRPGEIIFGIVMWCAALSSVLGAAYTSVSFIRNFHSSIERNRPKVIICFIVLSVLTFVLIGRPVTVLIVVGALNAMILPLGLVAVLVAAYKKSIVGDYRHPILLTITGAVAAAMVFYLSIATIVNIFA